MVSSFIRPEHAAPALSTYFLRPRPPDEREPPEEREPPDDRDDPPEERAGEDRLGEELRLTVEPEREREDEELFLGELRLTVDSGVERLPDELFRTERLLVLDFEPLRRDGLSTDRVDFPEVGLRTDRVRVFVPVERFLCDLVSLPRSMLRPEPSFLGFGSR
jgi:hypothetical protein